jgi:ferredoxin-nitrite reductase
MDHPDYQDYVGKEHGEKDMWQQGACLTITTRQNLQLYGIRLENVPEHWEALRGAGVFSLQAGMDNVRNLVGNPIAGIDPEEIVDTRPFCDEFTRKLTNNGNGNPELTNLPRKFNVCYIGSKEMFEHPDINDIAYLPSKGPNGQMGWHVDVGGLLTSTLCEFAVPLNAWVPQDKHWEVGYAIMTTFRDFGYRYNPRTKCRLMYLINDMGMQAFRDEVAKRYKAQTGSDLLTEEAITEKLVPTEWKRRELLGAHKQADGNNWLGLNVPAGRLYNDELKQLLDIIETYAGSELRMTVESNFILPHIPDDKLASVRAAVKSRLPRFLENPATISKGSVSCTGNQFCGQSKINTKGNTVEYAELMDAKFDFPEGTAVRVHWTGCPNTCAQVQIGDIGLLGTTGKDSTGKVVECVDVYTGGGIGQTSAIATLYKKAVPIDEQLEQVLSQVLVEKFGAIPKKADKAAPAAGSLPLLGEFSLNYAKNKKPWDL